MTPPALLGPLRVGILTMSDHAIHFPADRFAEAGATEGEVVQLSNEFRRSDLTVQVGMTNYFAGVSTADLGDYVESLREAGHFKTSGPVEDESESMAADPDPGSESGALVDDPAGDLSAPDDDEAALALD